MLPRPAAASGPADAPASPDGATGTVTGHLTLPALTERRAGAAYGTGANAAGGRRCLADPGRAALLLTDRAPSTGVLPACQGPRGCASWPACAAQRGRDRWLSGSISTSITRSLPGGVRPRAGASSAGCRRGHTARRGGTVGRAGWVPKRRSVRPAPRPLEQAGKNPTSHVDDDDRQISQVRPPMSRRSCGEGQIPPPARRSHRQRHPHGR